MSYDLNVCTAVLHVAGYQWELWNVRGYRWDPDHYHLKAQRVCGGSLDILLERRKMRVVNGSTWFCHIHLETTNAHEAAEWLCCLVPKIGEPDGIVENPGA